jgi:hypothetical protein
MAGVTWSYSYLTSFETCPRRHNLTRILKAVTEQATVATTHGNEVHKALELHIKGTQELPDKYRKYLRIVDAVRNAPGEKHAEIKFGVTQDRKPTTFFGKDVWVRGVLDLAVVQGSTATVLDWKTGKPKPDADQLELFAAAAFSMYPLLERVSTGYVWLAHNRVDKQAYTRDQAEGIWKKFDVRVQRINEAIEFDEFPPVPSGLCRAYCPVPKSMCRFSGKS